jgi:hypothetical protein
VSAPRLGDQPVWRDPAAAAVSRPVAAARDAVFVSYSHDDQDWRRKFMVMLAPDVRNHGLVLWDDTLIPVGDDWRRDIDDGVRRAGVALLLVTGSYLGSGGAGGRRGGGRTGRGAAGGGRPAAAGPPGRRA